MIRDGRIMKMGLGTEDCEDITRDGRIMKIGQGREDYEDRTRMR